VGAKDFERGEDRDREDDTRDSKAALTEECAPNSGGTLIRESVRTIGWSK